MTLASVWLENVKVGSIERFADLFDTHVFSFDPGYLSLASRPVLGQLFEDRLPAPIETHGLPLWFDHLLPQGPLREAIAAEADLAVDDALGLLVWLGEELPGAVRVIHEEVPPQYRRAPKMLQTAGGSASLRVSLSGMQWKVSVSRSDRGLTLPVRGQESDWIAKFQGRELPRLVQVEHATMRWARAIGLEVPEVELVQAKSIENLPSNIPLSDGTALLIRRFDRHASGRTHMEDLAQVLDRPDQFRGSHEEIAAVIKDESPEDRNELIRRFAFVIGSGNSDAHLKNWSVLYPGGRRARLSPAYDQIATVVYRQFPPTLALMVGTRRDARFDSLRRVDLVLFGTALGLDSDAFFSAFCADLNRTIESFELIASELALDERNAILAHFASIKGLLEA